MIFITLPIPRSLARPLSLEALRSLLSVLAFFLAAIFGELLSECAGVEGAARLLLLVPDNMDLNLSPSTSLEVAAFFWLSLNL